MAGVSLVGYCGSLIKDTIKDSDVIPTLLLRFVKSPNGVPEARENPPESATVLAGMSIPASDPTKSLILGDWQRLMGRRILHSLCADIVRFRLPLLPNCMNDMNYQHCRAIRCGRKNYGSVLCGATSRRWLRRALRSALDPAVFSYPIDTIRCVSLALLRSSPRMASDD
jgi:hypothetical protein